MPKEKIHIYCYGFNAAGIPLALYDLEDHRLTEADKSYFELWQQVVRSCKFPAYCILHTEKLPDLVGLPEDYQKSIVLLFSMMKNLADADTYHQLPMSELRRISARNEGIGLQDQPVSNFNYQPIITIGERDIMHLYEKPGQEEKDIRDFPPPDPRFKFFDSSIWHRYIPLYRQGEPAAGKGRLPADLSDFQKELEQTIAVMTGYHADNLYVTNAARSALELQLRLLKESFIERFGNRGHYKAVMPFKFHSERGMAAKTAELIDEFYLKFLKGCKKIEWNILMVDDYANSKISTFFPFDDEGMEPPARYKHLLCKKTKVELIRKLLKELEAGIFIGYPKAIHSEDPVPIWKNKHQPDDSSKTNIIDTCLGYLKKGQYDLILLDYLLGRVGDSEHREFGHEFLYKLNEDAEQAGLLNRGPFGRFWIFPISSFPFAMEDKLRQLGISNFNPWWHLVDGADPISTPELFRYSLLSFLKSQISEVLLPTVELEHVVKKFAYTYNQKLWTSLLAAQINERLLKIKLLKANEDKSKFAKTLSRKLSENYTELLEGIKAMADAFQQDIDFYRNLTSFNVIYEPWASLKRKFGQEEYAAEVIAGIDQQFERLSIFGNLRRAEHRVNEFILTNKSRLELDSQGLFVLPDNLATVSHIEALSLRFNKLETLPDFLADLNRLTYLDLTGNPIEKIPPVLFTLKKQLSYLCLRDTKIELSSRSLEAKGPQDVMDLLEQAQLGDLNNWISRVEIALEKTLLLDALDILIADPATKLTEQQRKILVQNRRLWREITRDYKLNLISFDNYMTGLAQKLAIVSEILEDIKKRYS
jgi:hypothetical protein